MCVWIHWRNNSGAKYLFHCQHQWELNQKKYDNFWREILIPLLEYEETFNKQNQMADPRGSTVLSICTYDSIGSDMSTNDSWSCGKNMSKNKTH